MLYGAALQQVAPEEIDEKIEIIEVEGVEKEAFAFMLHSNDRVELILQWIQRLVVDNIYSDVLPIAPPILSRVFQELSRGIVNLTNARKIAEFPFPFPYCQLLWFSLFIQYIITPILLTIV